MVSSSSSEGAIKMLLLLKETGGHGKVANDADHTLKARRASNVGARDNCRLNMGQHYHRELDTVVSALSACIAYG